MSKHSILFSGLLVAVLSCGAVTAADNPQSPQPQATDPAAGGATTSKREQEYLSALKKCEPMAGAEKSRCIDAAKKRYGQM